MLERQKAPKIEQISPDHVERYKFAFSWISDISECYKAVPSIADAACGCGYGSYILSEITKITPEWKYKPIITSLDYDNKAIEYAKENYSKDNIEYIQQDLNQDGYTIQTDILVCMETLEHLDRPESLLNAFKGDVVIFSVPNQRKFKYHPRLIYHKRHYTKEQIEGLFRDCGFKVTSIHHQDKIPCGIYCDDKERRYLIGVAIREAGHEET